ncbi:MAG: MarR family transcriptional regulator [Armatimonadota bacterium]
MQSFDKQTNYDTAALVVETVLLGMRTIRAQTRRGRPADLTVPQFRVLAFLNRHENASLTCLAGHMGLGLPSMSKTVDLLVQRGLVKRESSADDRRRITLNLTDKGKEVFGAAAKATRECIAEKLSSLTDGQRQTVIEAMNILTQTFAPTPGGKK